VSRDGAPAETPAGSPDPPLITHPEKVLFPADGITKGELAAYYQAVAPLMLPHLQGRPVTLERYPAGIGRKGFWQKDVSRGFPSWLQRVEVAKKDGVVCHPLASDARSLAWMANQNAVTLHVWPSRSPRLSHPDLCVFDLDPEDYDPPVASAATLQVRDLLAELGLSSWVKTTGSKGFHVAVPLDGTADSDQVAAFAHRVGALLVARYPERLTQEFHKVDRGPRVLVDTGRNGWSATFAAVYTVRARPGAPVSAPCSWAEVEDGAIEPRSFTLRSMMARLQTAGDLWSDLAATSQSVRAASERLNRL
jgi:bifunctional non-homologous end joining protein LigD